MVESTRADVIAAVEEICGLESHALADDSDLETLGIDSIDLIEVGMIIEEKYDVVLDGALFEGVTTFGGAVMVFDRLVGADSTDTST